VRLATLLEDAGVDPRAQWILAEGADASGMSRSVPLEKAMGDALVAIYQNGEPVRPSNGYPMRLLLPGYEGNMNVKWLRRIKLTEGPTMTKDETSKYTMLQNDGKSLQFCFAQEAKSVITRPSPGLTMGAPGLYEINGSLPGRVMDGIAKVEVSADGGASWASAALQEPVLPMAVTRFRSPWRWDGGPATLQSRATDDSGYVQPTRSKLIADRGARATYHFNGIASWAVAQSGEGKTCLRITRLLAACLVLLAGYGTALAESPNLGKTASPEEIASWDISIGPGGAGLPSGSGTPQQGEQVYLAKCLACHGEKRVGQAERPTGRWPRIRFGPGQAPVKTVGSFWPYATTLFDYVRRAMPLNESKSSAMRRYMRWVAYILLLNGIIGESDKIDAHTLPAVRMPNRDGFVRFFPREMILNRAPDVRSRNELCGKVCFWRILCKSLFGVANENS